MIQPKDTFAELAKEIHAVADQLSSFSGELPEYVSLTFSWTDYSGSAEHHRLALALTEHLMPNVKPEVKQDGRHYRFRAEEVNPARLYVSVNAYVPRPAEEDPAKLRARIAELEAQLQGDR